MKRARTTPTTLYANGLYNPFTGNKKWVITCGECEHTWRENVPFRGISSAVCPCCSTQNTWNTNHFMELHQRRVAELHKGVGSNKSSMLRAKRLIRALLDQSTTATTNSGGSK